MLELETAPGTTEEGDSPRRTSNMSGEITRMSSRVPGSGVAAMELEFPMPGLTKIS